MSSAEDFGLGDVGGQFARVPNLFLIDTSGSMTRKSKDKDGNEKAKIEQVNEGLKLFKQEIKNHFDAYEGVDVSIVTFGSDVDIKQEFTPIKDWTPPQLDASGTTQMCEAIVEGAYHLEDYKDAVDGKGLSRKRALVWLLTDGRPDNRAGSQEWNNAQDTIERGTGENHFLMFAGAIGDEADKGTLEDLVSVTDDSDASAFGLDDNAFKEYFRIASKSATTQSEEGKTDTSDLMSQQDLDEN